MKNGSLFTFLATKFDLEADFVRERAAMFGMDLTFGFTKKVET